MFPSVKTRFASAARRGFDLAIEFATLGEYGLAVAPADARPKPSPARVPPIRPRPSQVKPATPAARRLQPVPLQRRISTHSGVRALAFDARGPRPPLRGGRKRAGAAGPQPQPCLVAEAGGPAAMDR
jgi:hypothetical protein